MTVVIFTLSFSYRYQSVTSSGLAGGAVENCPLAWFESGGERGFAAKFSHVLGISGFFWLLQACSGGWVGFSASNDIETVLCPTCCRHQTVWCKAKSENSQCVSRTNPEHDLQNGWFDLQFRMFHLQKLG